MLDFSQFEYLTFDCCGTLINWEAGILGALRPILSARGVQVPDEEVLRLYGECEAEAESGDFRIYREILEGVVGAFGQRLGFSPSVAETQSLPQSLADWGEINLEGNVLPWLRGEPYARVKRGMAYLLLKSEVSKAARRTRSRAVRLLFEWFRKPLAWRVKNYFFRWPVELGLAFVRRWLVMRRSLLTGKA